MHVSVHGWWCTGAWVVFCVDYRIGGDGGRRIGELEPGHWGSPGVCVTTQKMENF